MSAPRLGFVGVGWIGMHRMQAIVEAGAGSVAGVVDPDLDAAARAASTCGGDVVDGLDRLLELDLDGLVVATPSALHAEQVIAGLSAGLPVFCQKPLGRNGAEVRRIVDAARRADRRLAVDLSYRHTEALRAVRELVTQGELGAIHAVDLVFHNAYGPDKAWFLDPASSGGGCVIDLGIHLVDAALWLLDWPEVREVRSRLYRRGDLLGPAPSVNEDHAVAELLLGSGATVRLACSWFLHAGQDAVIEAQVWGTAGGARMRNVDGSFYDFVAERCRGTACERIVEPPDGWGGRAAVAWARALREDAGFDEAHGEQAIVVADVLDAIYGR